MFNDAVDTLPATTNDRLAASHSFQINASQAFVRTGQHKDRAALHRFSNLRPTLAAEELNSFFDAKFASEIFKLASLRPFADDAASEVWKRGREPANDIQHQPMPFARKERADSKNF